MSWKPFQIPHNRQEAIESARWLKDRIAGIPEPDKPILPEATRERVLRPQLERVIANWQITESELNGGDKMTEKYKSVADIPIEEKVFVKDERLKRLIMEVWEVLPENVREECQQILGSIALVSADQTNVLAFAQLDSLRFSTALLSLSDEKIRWTIAHELAHIYCQHYIKTGARIYRLCKAGYDKDSEEIKMLERIMTSIDEREADLYAIAWLSESKLEWEALHK